MSLDLIYTMRRGPEFWEHYSKAADAWIPINPKLTADKTEDDVIAFVTAKAAIVGVDADEITFRVLNTAVA